MTKPHKGKIHAWRKVIAAKGFVIHGVFDGHPKFSGLPGYTSRVLVHNETTGEIETKNSRYTLV